MDSNLERSSKLKLLQSGDSTSSRQAMRSLVNYDSDGHSEHEDATPDPEAETPVQTQVLPDVDTIIQETKAEIQQARLKADTLICRYFEEFVATAGQLREGAIQRYRKRLEELPAKDRAKVCETLAEDETVCSNMEFGDCKFSYGGISFSYRAESVEVFNSLSHHSWKDCENHTRLPPARRQRK